MRNALLNVNLDRPLLQSGYATRARTTERREGFLEPDRCSSENAVTSQSVYDDSGSGLCESEGRDPLGIPIDPYVVRITEPVEATQGSEFDAGYPENV